MQQEVIENVLEALGASDIGYTGNGWMMSCCLHTEKHNDTRRSMKVRITDDGEPSIYKCHSCGSKGRVLDLITRMSYLHKKDYTHLYGYAKTQDDELYTPSWNDAVNKAKKKIEFTCSPQSLPRRFIPFLDFENKTTVKEADAGLKYLRKRKISNKAIKEAQLLYDPYERRIILPVIQLDGLCYGYTSRSIVEDEDFPLRKVKATRQWDFGNVHSFDDTYEATYTDKGGKMRKSDYMKVRDAFGMKKTEFILGMHLWKDGLPVLIIEGLFGYLHLLTIGAGELLNIGCTMGAELSDLQAHRLKVYGKPVFLLFDNDKAGIEALLGSTNSRGAIDKLHNSVVVCTPNWPKIKETADNKAKLDKFKRLFSRIKTTIDKKEKKRLKQITDGYTMDSRGEVYKADPDRLTLKDVEEMKLNAEIV